MSSTTTVTVDDGIYPIHRYEDPHTGASIEVLLSRPSYRLGETIVGTVRLLPPPLPPLPPPPSKSSSATKTTTTDFRTGNTPRTFFSSAHLYVVGRCKIDARWHNPDEYKRLYGRAHPHLTDGSCQNVEEFFLSIPPSEKSSSFVGNTTVCVWATNVVSMLDLPERTVGTWRMVKPNRPLRRPPPSPELYFKEHLLMKADEDGEDDDFVQDKDTDKNSHNNKNVDRDDELEKRQLVFTFRAELPKNIPPSASLTCCRYSYAVVVSCTTRSGENLVMSVPFSVWTPRTGGSDDVTTKRNDATKTTTSTGGRVKLGNCAAMAHSSGLPCHVTVDEIHEPKGQLSINRHSGSLASKVRQPVQDTKTLRISDPAGRPCCVLTAIGTSQMSPGDRVLFQVDFPTTTSPQRRANGGEGGPSQEERWVPCYQIDAKLSGQEIALYEDQTEAPARTFEFDSFRQNVDFGYTERVSFSLLLPLDCPYSMQTDLVKVVIVCTISLTIDGINSGYSNLRMDLPIQVVHSPTAEEVDLLEDELRPTLQELLHGSDFENDDPMVFQTKDITKDLKILSLALVDAWKLFPDDLSSR